jgi:uncharacterized membrane protein
MSPLILSRWHVLAFVCLALFPARGGAAPATFRTIPESVVAISPSGTILTPSNSISPSGVRSAEFNAFGVVTRATAISDDGSVIAGHGSTTTDDFYHGWIRRSDGLYQPIGSLGGGHSTVYGMSADGTQLVGTSRNSDGRQQGFHWSSTLSIRAVPFLPNAAEAYASSISADGRAVSGTATVLCPECQSNIVAWDCALADCGPPTPSYRQAYIWTAAGGTKSLGSLPATQSTDFWFAPVVPSGSTGKPLPPDSDANAISDDGTTVVGYAGGTGLHSGFVWRAETGMLPIPNLGEFNTFFMPYDTSGDGSVVVGGIGGSCGTNCFSGPGATVWDAQHGTRLLKSVLVDHYGLGAAIGNTFLEAATFISADGLTLAGAVDRTKGGGSWIVTLPTPLTMTPTLLAGDFNRDGIVDAADFSIWRNSLGQNGANLPADANHDNRIDQQDYSLWKKSFGSRSESLSGSASFAALPEPASPVPFIFGALAIASGGRAKRS